MLYYISLEKKNKKTQQLLKDLLIIITIKKGMCLFAEKIRILNCGFHLFCLHFTITFLNEKVHSVLHMQNLTFFVWCLQALPVSYRGGCMYRCHRKDTGFTSAF